MAQHFLPSNPLTTRCAVHWACSLLLGVLTSACGTLASRGSHPMLDELNMELKLPGGRPGSIGVPCSTFVDSARGTALSSQELFAALGTRRVVHVGETHDSPGHHRLQRRIIESLSEKGPGWAIGLEMLPVATQPILDRWVAGELDELSFVEQVGWYRRWGYDYRLYRPIFQLARQRKLPLLALNISRKLARKVGRGGIAALTPNERAALPEVDLGSAEHRRVFTALVTSDARHHPPKKAKAKASSAGHKAAPASHHKPSHDHGPMLDNLYQAQSLWDEAMAATVLRYLKADSSHRVVVLAGTGHVAYDLGISMRLRRRQAELGQSALGQAIVQAVVCGEKPRKVARQVADYFFGLPEKETKPAYPSLGVIAKLVGTEIEVSSIKAHSAAATAGLRKGDRIVSIGGQAIRSLFDLRWALIDRTFGDRLELQLRRNKATQTVSLRLVRTKPKSK